MGPKIHWEQNPEQFWLQTRVTKHQDREGLRFAIEDSEIF
jgi:hypothetical protein